MTWRTPFIPSFAWLSTERGEQDHGSIPTASWSPATPRALPLEEHQEIVVAYGTKAELPKPILSSYPFPAGL